MAKKRTKKLFGARPQIGGRNFILRVDLDDVRPPAWRRFVVPASITLDRLHEVLQVVMGWSDAHQHAFVIDGKHFVRAPSDQTEGMDEAGVVLGTLVNTPGSTFKYEYDFGDGWTHTVTIDSVVGQKGADVVCLEGQGKCPPENVGGPYAYATFVSSLTDPTHPEHKSNLTWHGGPFDPNDFNRDGVNALLARGGLAELTHLERLTEKPQFEWDDDDYPGGFNARDEANALIAMAVRNGPIENLHAGQHSPLLEDKTLSRITDAEMKEIMVNATAMLAKLLRMRDRSPELYKRYIREYGKMYCRSWEREQE